MVEHILKGEELLKGVPLIRNRADAKTAIEQIESNRPEVRLKLLTYCMNHTNDPIARGILERARAEILRKK